MSEAKKKALVAMSGGVDSSVAAALICDAGYDAIGVTMKLYDNETVDVCRENTCCTLEDTEDARQVATSLGMPYYVFNFTEDFDRQVIERFVRTYEEGGTPNPCIDCNRYMKHEKLYHRAETLGCDVIVTGHYARIEQDPATGRWLLKKAKNLAKDQSYVLYFLTQQQLAHTMFPLGNFASKEEVREAAEKYGFINARKHDSQDICFVVNGDYGDFIENYTGKSFAPGKFVDTEGHVLGEHKGIIRYTIGQRKGLGLGGGPWFVVKKDIEKNIVFVSHGYDTRQQYGRQFLLTDFHFLTADPWNGAPLADILFKIRHTEPPIAGTLCRQTDGRFLIRSSQEIQGIAPGQFGVLYTQDGTICAGSGEITV